MTLVHLEGISPRAWEHPADAAALQALRRLPGFDVVVRKTLGRLNEWAMKMRLGKGAVEVTDRSHPRLHRIYTEVLHTLDAPEAWPLYVQRMTVINAAAMGMEAPFISVADKALDQLGDDALRVILAHEVGHVMSGHVLYKTMLRVLLYAGWAALSFPLSTPLVLGVIVGLAEWDRKSELSADRASVLAVQDPALVIHTLQSVQGSHDDGIGADFERLGLSRDAAGLVDRVVASVREVVGRHPPIERRIEEIRAWEASGAYAAILAGEYPRREHTGTDPTWGEVKDKAQALGEGLKGAAEPVREWLHEARGAATRQAGAAAAWFRRVSGEE